MSLRSEGYGLINGVLHRVGEVHHRDKVRRVMASGEPSVDVTGSAAWGQLGLGGSPDAAPKISDTDAFSLPEGWPDMH